MASLLPTVVNSSTPAFKSCVVSVTFNGHRVATVNFEDINVENNSSPFTAYGQSETAKIWLVNYINRVWSSQGVHAISVIPGAIWTGWMKNLPSELKNTWTADPVMSDGMKSSEQGAATTVWAAVSKAREGKGGEYLEDCAVGAPSLNVAAITSPGYAPHGFDEAGEEPLWELSCSLTGITAEI